MIKLVVDFHTGEILHIVQECTCIMCGKSGVRTHSGVCEECDEENTFVAPNYDEPEELNFD